MLSTAHYIVDGREDLYKPTHRNHPCSKWCRSTQENYKWLYSHFRALAMEYEYRYEKVHKTWEKLGEVLALVPSIRETVLEEFPQAMGDVYERCKGVCSVKAYREYYKMREKEIMMRWTKRLRPEWLG
jgi:hypothetical protein